MRWVGAAYLCFLGAQRNWSQGFVSNITNPKALAFYLSVLPQFLAGGAVSLSAGALLAYSHAALSLVWLLLIVAFVHSVRAWVTRRRVRRTLDTGTGVALLGFASALILKPAGP